MSGLRFSLALVGAASASVAQGVPETVGDPGNDWYGLAETTVFGAQHYGQLSAPGDLDHWRCQVTTAGRLSVWTSARGRMATPLTQVRILDSFGLEVSSTPDPSPTAPAAMARRAAWLEPGTYYVQVSAPGTAFGDYAFDLLFDPGGITSGWSLEPNGDCATATAAAMNSTRVWFLSRGDVDFYSVVTTDEVTVRFEAIADLTLPPFSPLDDVAVWVYDSACVEIAYASSTPATPIARVDLPVEPGTYYAEVSHPTRRGTGGYRFTVSRSDSTATPATSVTRRFAGACAGLTAPGIALVDRLGERPHVGMRWTVDVFDVRPVSAILVGATQPGPLDLTVVGAPGCHLGIQTVFASIPIVPTVGVDTEFGVDLGGQVGLSASLQAVALDVGANALGVITSAEVVDIVTGDRRL